MDKLKQVDKSCLQVAVSEIVAQQHGLAMIRIR